MHQSTKESAPLGEFVEEIELAGHIIDSLILPKVLDVITSLGGEFRIKEVAIGHGRTDASFALIEIGAHSEEMLKRIIAQVADHGGGKRRGRIQGRNQMVEGPEFGDHRTTCHSRHAHAGSSITLWSPNRLRSFSKAPVGRVFRKTNARRYRARETVT